MSSSSAISPSASAPICRLDASARRRRLARPKRHETPRCGRRFSRAIKSRATTVDATTKSATPPTMMAPACASRACHAISTPIVTAPAKYASAPPTRGRGRSRRKTRSGGTFASATSGGSAKPNSNSMPVMNAASAGGHVGGGNPPENALDSSTTSSACPPSATVSPAAQASAPRATNCVTNKTSVFATDAPKQRSIAAASR